MVLLYEHPLSPYAQKVKIALAEKGVAFECRLPDFMSGRDDAFAAATPRLEVPALVDGDTRVFDSTIILEYIEDRWPTPPLLPAAPAERARVRMLEELCDTYVEPISWAAMEIRVFKRAGGALAERLLARGAEHAGLRDAPAARRVRALQARVPRPPARVDDPQRGGRRRARRHAQGQHPLQRRARLRGQLSRRACFQG